MQKFTNATSQARLISMQELLRRETLSAQQLAARCDISERHVRQHIEHLLTFGGMEITTRFGKTKFYHCVTPEIVTFTAERKPSVTNHVARKAAESVPYRDTLTAAFFGPRI